MRTTVDLDDTLFRKAKAQAAMEGIPLKPKRKIGT